MFGILWGVFQAKVQALMGKFSITEIYLSLKVNTFLDRTSKYVIVSFPVPW